MKSYLTNCILLVALAFFISMSASANPITLEQARQRAEQFLQKQPGSRRLSPVLQHAKLSPRRFAKAAGSTIVPSLGVGGGTATAQPLYYVFDRGTDEGYIIVSGDDQTLPVLGYTDHGSFDYRTLPPNMIFWLEGYENELADLRNTPASEANAYNPDAPRVGDVPVHDPIAYLCTSTWNQGDPYNQSCPMYFNLGRSVTGCVATAMAQILYYHRDKSVNETQAAMPAYEAWAELG